MLVSTVSCNQDNAFVHLATTYLLDRAYSAVLAVSFVPRQEVLLLAAHATLLTTGLFPLEPVPVSLGILSLMGHARQTRSCAGML